MTVVMTEVVVVEVVVIVATIVVVVPVVLAAEVEVVEVAVVVAGAVLVAVVGRFHGVGVAAAEFKWVMLFAVVPPGHDARAFASQGKTACIRYFAECSLAQNADECSRRVYSSPAFGQLHGGPWLATASLWAAR